MTTLERDVLEIYKLSQTIHHGPFTHGFMSALRWYYDDDVQFLLW